MASCNLNFTRRGFLKTVATGTAAGLLGGATWLQGEEAHDLAVISGEPVAATKKALEALGGISRFVKKGARVLIKPNMSFATPPERASTTHPLVVATVAQACVDAGAQQVLVVDHTLQRPELCLERTGIREACKPIRGCHVLALREGRFFKEVKVPDGRVLDRIEVVKEVSEGYVLINIPVAKSHSTTGVSLGLKGLMGLILDRESFHSRYNINDAIADLATVVRPQLTILDATRALASGGPGGPGDVKKPNLVIAGVDPVAVDAYGVSVVPWYGQTFKARQVEHLLIAHKRGLGKIDIEGLRIFKERA